MNVYHLGDEQVTELLGLPETGMGFQLLEATFWGDRKQFLVFNGYLAVDLSPLELDFTVDSSVIEKNEARIVGSHCRTMFPLRTVIRSVRRSEPWSRSEQSRQRSARQVGE